MLSGLCSHQLFNGGNQCNYSDFSKQENETWQSEVASTAPLAGAGEQTHAHTGLWPTATALLRHVP